MGEFGWAYISGSSDCAQGPDQSVQFATGALGSFGRPLSGSRNFIYDAAENNLLLTGSMYISGTIKANIFDVISTVKTEIGITGSTNFGDSEGDTHNFTGSLSIISGSFRKHYYKMVGSSHTVAAYDCIVGVSSSDYVSITLPSAATAGFGKIVIIKDEWGATRADEDRIAVSASGGQTIDHYATYSLTGDNPALSIYSDGISKWFIY